MEIIVNKNKKNKSMFILANILTILITIASIYALYAISLLSGIEDMTRFFIALIITIACAGIITFNYKKLKKTKFKKRIILILLITIYSLILIASSFIVDRTFGRLSGLSSSKVTYSSSLVSLVDNEANNILTIDNKSIGILNDKDSIDGYQIPQEIIKTNKIDNKIVKYDNYIDLLNALYDEEISYAFLPTNYGVLFQNIVGFANLKSETKIIYTLDKKVQNETSGANKITKPFTILLMGVDSEKENIAGSSFNGDALMLITFNPKTLNTTILSIPRDTYVPIACFSGQRENKITHAAWYGQDCMINTIEAYTGINIDYFVKINFRGVVDLVDSLGGIEVDVPYNFCESNSNREFGKNKTVYVEKGLQNLTGEEVLALARNRHPNPDHCSSKWTNYVSNDFIRGENQQLILKSLLGKLKDVRSIDVVNNILETISNNVETNMSTNEILSLYDIAKRIISASSDSSVDLFGMQRLSLSGYDYYIYDYSLISKQGIKMSLYNFVAYSGSLKDVTDAMKVNLGLLEEEDIKTFSFNANDPYEEVVIGSGNYQQTRLPLVENFIGKDVSRVTEFGNKYNIKVTINYITSSNPNHVIGTVTNQNAHAEMDIKYIGAGGLVVDVVNAITPISIDCSSEVNANNDYCLIPNFIGDTKSDVSSWFSLRDVNVRIVYNEIDRDSEDYIVGSSGKVTKQSVNANTSIYNLINKTITIEYME